MKWIILGWTIFCLIGFTAGMVNVYANRDKLIATNTEEGQAAAALGCIVVIGLWGIVWGAVAVPSSIIYLVCPKSTSRQSPSPAAVWTTTSMTALMGTTVISLASKD